MKPELAHPEDVDAVYALLHDAAVWLTVRGVSQWKPGALPRSLVENGIARGEIFVVRSPSRLVATLQLTESDPEIWGDDAGVALYLHRLCVARADSGKGLGLRLLDWASAEARTRGRRMLRLDCVASNVALRRYYEAAGFEPRGEVDVGIVLARFERVA